MPCKYRGKLINKKEKVACKGIEGIDITRPSYKCSVHKCCIDQYNPQNGPLIKWNERFESKMFKLCRQCSEHSELSHNENSEK